MKIKEDKLKELVNEGFTINYWDFAQTIKIYQTGEHWFPSGLIVFADSGKFAEDRNLNTNDFKTLINLFKKDFIEDGE